MLGVRTSGAGDDNLHVAHRAPPILDEAKALHLHLGESTGCKITICDEGQACHRQRLDALLTFP